MDEQAGERGHKRYKHARSHLARKTSPEANIMDMLKLSLAWSDPKMSDDAYLLKKSSKPVDDKFSRDMAEYFKSSTGDTTGICGIFCGDTDDDSSSNGIDEDSDFE